MKKYTKKQIKESISYWKKVLSQLNESSKPMTQDELEDYCKSKLGNKWEDVIKTAWIKVVEKAEAGKKYETVTRDENGGTWKETVNTAKDGDFLIQNAYGSGKDRKPDEKKDPSKWLLAGAKIKKNYQVDGEVEVGKCYAPNPVPRKGIMLKEPIVIVASWGEEMNCKKGDWLVKAGEKDVYRVEKVVFSNTYSKGTRVGESKKTKYTKKQIVEAIQYWQNKLNEGKIADFFGKLLKTKAWKDQQKKLADEKDAQFKKEHPLAAVAEVLRSLNSDYKTAYGTIDFENDGYPIDFSKEGDVMFVRHMPPDQHDVIDIDKLEQHPDIEKAFAKCGLKFSDYTLVPIQYDYGIIYQKSNIMFPMIDQAKSYIDEYKLN